MVIFACPATSDDLFPSVGGLGHLPQRLPHQSAEHLPGLGPHQTGRAQLAFSCPLCFCVGHGSNSVLWPVCLHVCVRCRPQFCESFLCQMSAYFASPFMLLIKMIMTHVRLLMSPCLPAYGCVYVACFDGMHVINKIVYELSL